ncbi:MAG TPA: hypothetical protein VK553_03730 [Candidatus Nitrosopolaris rasttigaisensis]|nr:hypothetical protein [Candidatus Nitrosopolaris rasttigaisensis]
MASDNPFPESAEKNHLRIFHLQHALADYCESIGHPLSYFGLPSAEMRDVEMWRPLLSHITAVERDPDVALRMYRNAQKLGIRDKTVVIEMNLVEATKLLAMEDKEIELSLALLPSSVRDRITQVRRVSHHVVNLDLCGGFLYPSDRGESENAKLLRNLINFQAKQKTAFLLILTFALRDTGKDDYDSFITETLDHLNKLGINTSALRKHYTSTRSRVAEQPPNLRRLRFCVPGYLHKIAFDNFQVSSLGAWYYKTFYHAILFFEPRKGRSALGKAWPPIDEFKELLSAPMTRLKVNGVGEVIEEDLPAPSLP